MEKSRLLPETPLDLKEALRALFPSMSEEELASAVLNFSDYLHEVSVFYDALATNPERYARFTELTASEPRATVKDGPVAPIRTNPLPLDA
jgi:hypothetical protein